MSETLILPTQRSEVEKRWVAQKFVVIGPPGVGKSSLFSTAERTLYIACEKGLNHLSVVNIPCRGWSEFKNIGSALTQAKNEGKLPYDTIVIDTVDKWIDLGHEEVIERGEAKFKNIEINTVGDIPNGAGWAWSTDLIENALDKLTDLGVAVVLLGHLESKEVKSPTMSIHKQTISIGGKMGAMICAWADHILSVEARAKGNDVSRVVRTQGTTTLEAKSRGAMIPDGWVWSANIDENYKKLRGFFV